MDQIANLTMRQIALIYYRERDKKGIPKPIRNGRGNKKKSADQAKEEFFMLAEAFGLSGEEIERQWEASLDGKK